MDVHPDHALLVDERHLARKVEVRPPLNRVHVLYAAAGFVSHLEKQLLQARKIVGPDEEVEVDTAAQADITIGRLREDRPLERDERQACLLCHSAKTRQLTNKNHVVGNRPMRRVPEKVLDVALDGVWSMAPKGLIGELGNSVILTQKQEMLPLHILLYELRNLHPRMLTYGRARRL